MQVEILRDGELIAGPMPWDAARVRDIVMRQGGDYRLIPNGFLKAAHISSISVLPVRHIKPELAKGQAYGAADRAVTDEEVRYTYPVRDMAPEELEQELESAKHNKRKEIDRAREAAFNNGIACDIAGEPDVVQTRIQDKVNLLGLRMEAKDLEASGVTDAVMPFRGLSNVERLLSPQQVIDLTSAALDHIQSIYKTSWKLKDAVDNAETIEEVEGVKWYD